LKSITGVTTIQTGPTISKPMIHGLYGNRILIMNNGVRLEGQSWGAEHAPEIDPFIATKLSVIKGAASIRYGMDAVAGVVLVEPADLPHARCLRGEVNAVASTNGRSGTGSIFLEGAYDKKLTGLSWRIQGTTKRAGAYSTPDYYLTNTASNEDNYSAALVYNRKSFGTELYFSNFNTAIGIYAGSHAGNLKDLLLLFNSTKPIVPSEFSYDIRRGYQTVNHQTMKAKLFYNFKKLGKVELIFAQQENKRSEFGEDLSYNQGIVDANIPDAYFKLLTHTSELIWEHKSFRNISGSVGLSYMTQGNVFEGLDFRALIPNYRNYSGGVFVLEKWNRKKLTVEGGLRADYKWMRTYTQDFTTLKKSSEDFSWQNLSGSVGTTYRFNKHFTWNSSLSSGWRPPSPIELFALGVHQSAASYEIGDKSLREERSYNAQTFVNITYRRLRGELGGYYNLINNYIYLDPLSRPRVTVNGSFPAYQYRQADVYFTGFDGAVNFELTKYLSLVSRNTIIYAYNRTIGDYLIYVPSNRFQNGISFSRDSLKRLRQVYFNVSALVVTRQSNVPANSDYIPPPAGYTLLNADLGFSFYIRKQLVSINFSINNALNTVYRDYLNRFRYFSDDVGRNFTFRLKIPFTVFGKNADD
jgi:iron complex outermembrane recepter protein